MSSKKFDDLLIFGYACKIFRDDEKALHIDQGKHLIPWMGDSTLKIDRYDVRAALTDIVQYEPPPGGYDNRWNYLCAAEQRAEQLCEEERYFSLYNNDFEEELYKEENQKRLDNGYGQVAFNYDQTSTAQNDMNDESTKAENSNKDDCPDEPYIPHPRFYIPPGVELPKTTKVQAIIEKTARFISSQGPQMEILIKAKQANNPLFDFLNQSGCLNPFYKHTLQAMKDGNYPTENEQLENTNSTSTTEATGSIYQNYYSSNQPIVVPTIKYKPSADCAYTQLISKIKGVPILTENTSNDSEKISFGKSDSKSAISSHSKNNVEVKKISNGLMLAQYYNSDSEDDDEIDNSECAQLKETNSHNGPPNDEPQKKASPTPPLENDISIPPGILCPPPELRVIVDKTASYVLKNGKDFEDILRAKNDKRFTFLQYKDPYYKYYTFKVTGTICPDPVLVMAENSMQINCLGSLDSGKKAFSNKKIIAPVSFSIKSKDETTPATFKSVLGMEQSSDEETPKTESGTDKSAHNSDSTSKDLPLSPNSQQVNLSQSTPILVQKSKNGDESMNPILNDVEQSESFIRDTILEQQNIDEKRQAKRADERAKDRLANNIILKAREKLGILSKEKQLQLERKRRAMAFLNQINTEESTDAKLTKVNDKVPSSAREMVSSNLKSDNDNSDSSDSVTFVMASASTSICAAATQTVQKRRHIKANPNSSESDDVIEVEPRHSSVSHTRSRSRSRSKSTSSKSYRHKRKRTKKKSSKRSTRSRSRSRSRSRTSRYSKKRRSSSSKARKYRYSND